MEGRLTTSFAYGETNLKSVGNHAYDDPFLEKRFLVLAIDNDTLSF